MPAHLRSRFEATGFLGPVPVLERRGCRELLRALEHGPPPVDWTKGHAVSSVPYYSIGLHPPILDRVTAILGQDVMLWGASLVRRAPQSAHPWHTDIETSQPAGRTVTVWIGLQQTNRRSALQLVPYSHRFGLTLQEQARQAGRRRGSVTVADVDRWARACEPRSGVERFDLRDGDALFFDGRLWHGSFNDNRTARIALLLQYATPETAIRIPDLSVLDWPFRYLESPRPPCLMVRGTDRHAVNRMAPPPHADTGTRPRMTVRVESLDLPLAEDAQTGWKPYPIFRGATPCLPDLSCHVSVLSPGRTPHEPHQHPQEELLVLLAGEAELVIGEDGVPGRERRQRIRPGAFVYYPAGWPHTIHNPGDQPATYLMFKWRTDPASADGRPAETGGLEHAVFDPGDRLLQPAGEQDRPFATGRLVEGPTRYLRTLHAHVSTLQPGAGYDPHVDAYDVGIIVFGGRVETVGRRVGPHGLIFYAAGEPHGMRNVGDAPATYLVFEFHGLRPPSVVRPASGLRKAAALLPRPLKRMVRRSLSLVRR